MSNRRQIEGLLQLITKILHVSMMFQMLSGYLKSVVVAVITPLHLNLSLLLRFCS